MKSWSQTRLRYVADLNPRVRADLLAARETEVSFLPMDAIGKDGSLDLEKSRAVADVLTGYTYFEDGDVAFAKVTPCFENGKGALMHGLERGAGFGTSELTVMRPRAGTDARYLRYVIQSERFRQMGEGAMTGAGGLKRVPEEFTRDFATAWPHTKEQERVANFLDAQTARIDSLIAAKEALGRVLQEEMQACIDTTLLGGATVCDEFPFTPKDHVSEGVKWSQCMLKQHWTVTDCKHLTVDFVDEGFPLASIREVSSDVLDLTNAKRASQADYLNLIESGRKPRRGDLVYARNASVGAVALVDTDEDFAMGQDVCLITSELDDQQFLRLQMLSSPLKAQLDCLLQGATIRRVNVEQIRNFAVLVPPLGIQRKAVAVATQELRRRQILQDHLIKHIERLREYRSSLISAAVTGQLDIGEFKEAA